jgi:hypothetical protein
MWKDRLSYLASGTTVAIMVFMATNVNAETILSSRVPASLNVDRTMVNLSLTSSHLNFNSEQERSSLPNLGCGCAICQKVSTQVPF